MNELAECVGTLGRQVADEAPARPPYRHKLKGACVMRGYRSDRAIGEATGWSASLVNLVMRGTLAPSPGMQRAFCALLGIKMSELKRLL